ncbi:hypothetical protein DFJ74DRAFT_39722 [Hyaloraphidium curvatum]|nr:hypothetical protein DFJ74DRAFT_39722 [Hyaloraphidium curvatum]
MHLLHRREHARRNRPAVPRARFLARSAAMAERTTPARRTRRLTLRTATETAASETGAPSATLSASLTLSDASLTPGEETTTTAAATKRTTLKLTTTTTTTTTPVSTLPIPTQSLLPLDSSYQLGVYSAFNTTLTCNPTTLNCGLANPPSYFSLSCGARATNGSCLTFLMQIQPGNSLCLVATAEGTIAVRTCPRPVRLAELERRERAYRGNTPADLVPRPPPRFRRALNGTGVANQYWTVALFDPIPSNPTLRMLINTGRSSALGPGQGCLLRTVSSNQITLGDCAQPIQSNWTSTWAIPAPGESPPPQPPPTTAPLSGGAIAGIVLAAIATLLGMFGLTYWCVRIDKKKREEEERVKAEKAEKEKEAKERAAANGSARGSTDRRGGDSGNGTALEPVSSFRTQPLNGSSSLPAGSSKPAQSRAMSPGFDILDAYADPGPSGATTYDLLDAYGAPTGSELGLVPLTQGKSTQSAKSRKSRRSGEVRA